MKQSQKINTKAQLEELIERYFEGQTSQQEEQLLRESLADCPWESEAIDEARFTMGYFAAHKQQRRRIVNMSTRHRALGIAATIAVLLTIGVGLLWQSRQPEDVCIAYVNGQTINDKDKVLTLMQSDLNDMGNATQGIAEQLSSLGEVIEIDI
jgi:hypothetical protein